MEFKWQFFDSHEKDTIKSFADDLNSSPVLARVLLNRGIEDIESAREFFRPSLLQLHDPFLMNGMEKAIVRVQRAIESKQRIVIYGDYDVDGTTATSMLLLFLRQLHADVDFYIPERLVDGYGLSENGIRKTKEQNIDLIITVDCGITAVQEVEYANSLGIDVIICDHHQPGADLPPACAILNPKQVDCPYPFKELAGVGVAFKLVQGLQKHLLLDEDIVDNFLELVAIGSSADIVPLVDENRILVKHGLANLSKTKNLGLKALIEATMLSDCKIGTGQVVFVLAPRINAVGRLGDGGRAVSLLTSESQQQAQNIASILESENRKRRTIDEETFASALAIIEDQFDPEQETVFVLNSDEWHPGVIGIVASRIVEKYFRPTVMIATENGQGKGSARSIPGFDIYQALKRVENLMDNFGGHKYAAGLTIHSENIPEFRSRLSEVARETLTDEMLIPKLWIDAEISFHEIEDNLIKLLERMAPFGPQNPRPVFSTKDLQVVGTPTIVGKNHLKFKVRQKNIVMNAIGFNLGHLLYRISAGETNVEIAYVIEENEYQGKKKVQLRIKDLR